VETEQKHDHMSKLQLVANNTNMPSSRPLAPHARLLLQHVRDILLMHAFRVPSCCACAACSIDCTSYFELESMEYQKRGIQLSPELWLVKIMVRCTCLMSLML
jgi:hypothetical protein